MNPSFYFLLLGLFVGIVFVLWPNRYRFPFVGVKSSELETKKIRALILFVSTRKPDEPFEKLLAYKILSQMDSGKGKKRVWLFHSQEPSSKADANTLYSQFNDFEKLRISQHAIKDVSNISETYEKVNTFVYMDKYLDIHPGQISCECTAGPKPVTLGFALASLGRGKLIYFPIATQKEAHKYIIINASPPRLADIEP